MNSTSGAPAVVEPAHGTLYRHKRWRCSCDECRDHANAYRRKVHRLRGYGRWAPFVDAQPVREHVEAIRAAGIGTRRLAELSGVSYSTVQALLYGAPAEGKAPTQRMRPENAAAILAVRPRLEDCAPTALVDATGTRRRLQALTAIGWPAAVLSAEMGYHEKAVSRLRTADLVKAQTALAVRDLYDRLWDAAPPQRTPRQRGDITKARRLAAERGWVLPLEWDDDAIDDPEAVPHGTGPATGARGKLPPDEELVWLVGECRETHEAIADRFGVTPSAVRQALDRYRRSAA